MRMKLTLGAMILAAGGASAEPYRPPASFFAVADYFTRAVVQFGVMMARSAVELTYEDITVDLAAGRLSISGLRVRPALDYDFDGACEVRVAEIELAGDETLDASSSRFDLSGVELTPACLPPQPQAMLAAAGYGEALRAEAVTVNYSYEPGPSALKLDMRGVFDDVAEIEAALDFSYFWFQTTGMLGDGFSGDPAPVMDLASAEIVITDAGLLQRAGPMISDMIGGFETAPVMVEGGILQALTNGGQTPPPPGAAEFAAGARASVDAFLKGEGPLVVSVNPETPVFLTEDLADDPAALFTALAPTVSDRVAARAGLIGPELLAAVLSGGDMSDADRLLAGRALITGVGAPLAADAGRAVLAPLAEAWNGEAALLIADSLNADPGAAYEMALIAATAGEARARVLVNRLERRLSVSDTLDAQAAVNADWPGAPDAVSAIDAAVAAADIRALRNLASDAADGRGRPRDIALAYGLSLVAAAAGDRGAAALRENIDRRYRLRGGDDAGAWAVRRADIAGDALKAWVEDGVLGKLAAQ